MQLLRYSDSAAPVSQAQFVQNIWLRVQLFPINQSLLAGCQGKLRGGWQISMMPMALGTADLAIHHIFHVSNPCYGARFCSRAFVVRNSRRLIRDGESGLPVPRDGPGRNAGVGLCVLGLFWMFNTIAIAWLYHFS